MLRTDGLSRSWRVAVFSGCLLLTLASSGGCRNDSPDAESSPSTEVAGDRDGFQVPGSEQKLDLIAEGHLALSHSDIQAASRFSKSALLKDPESPEARWLAAKVAAANSDHLAALELARSIDLQSTHGLDAASLTAICLTHLGKAEEAAEHLHTAIKTLGELPDSDLRDQRLLLSRRIAAGLLNRVGRRQSASEQVDELVRHGVASLDELSSLVDRSRSFPILSPDSTEVSNHFAPGMGIARWHFSHERFREALGHWRKTLDARGEMGTVNPEAIAFEGRLLAETQSFEDLPAWFRRTDADTAIYSDYWAALGIYFADQSNYTASTRALLEAVHRNPTDRASVQRLAKALNALGRQDDAEQFRYRGILLGQAEKLLEQFAGNSNDVQLKQQMAQRVLELNRPFEALHWIWLATPESAVQAKRAINQRRLALLEDPNATSIASATALLDVRRDDFEITSGLESLQTKLSASSARASALSDQTLATPVLPDVAAELDLNFQWYMDTEIDIRSIPLHESLGGGIAVLDFDLDGCPDVYFAQGGCQPPDELSERSNKLFRNLGTGFRDVEQSSGTTDRHYSAGLAAGDVNQDGFLDLYLGAQGQNRLLINCGDGTFRDATAQCDFGSNDFVTASVAIADLDSDGLPDLYESNYLDAAGAYKETATGPDGKTLLPSPLIHYASADRWFANDAAGGFRMHLIGNDQAKPSSSLGVMVTDFDNDGTNEIFVANDARPNHYLKHDPKAGLVNHADSVGVSNGFEGTATGCMGIAIGDFDHNGRADLAVTNYFDETANLYLQVADGVYSDQAMRYRLDELTRRNIGFGCKAIDVDRNGWLDLLITNGHTFDMSSVGQPFQIPTQLLVGRNGHFETATVEDGTGYWREAVLGRAMAQLDFDRDGAIDVLVNHLDRPAVLLHNQTQSPGNWIQFELVGVPTERDATGAKLIVTTNKGTHSNWVTAGDGYLASDESVLDFGLGRDAVIEKVELIWPSGTRQQWADVSTNQRWLVIEGHSELWQRKIKSRPKENISGE